MTTHPDRRTLDLAARLTQLAPTIRTARNHIAHQYATTDGYASGNLDDGSRSTDGTSKTERTMLARLHLASAAAQINDDLDAIANIINSCQRTCTQAIGTRAPTQHEHCYADPGLAGYLTPLHEGGWMDPTCTNLPRSSTGLCNTCRVRLTRWRTNNNHKPLAETDAETDAETRITEGQHGTIHAWPTTGAA